VCNTSIPSSNLGGTSRSLEYNTQGFLLHNFIEKYSHKLSENSSIDLLNNWIGRFIIQPNKTY
ncbi:MAG: hypothetical protein V8Q57_09735, partial [Blautia sp.]